VTQSQAELVMFFKRCADLKAGNFTQNGLRVSFVKFTVITDPVKLNLIFHFLSEGNYGCQQQE
jgi:hypothetical protein